MIFLFFTLSLVYNALAYVPTVESLFRNGSNPDITSNGLMIPFQVKKIFGEAKRNEVVSSPITSGGDFFKIYMTKSNDTLKVSQTQYTSGSYSDNVLVHKIYYSNLTPFTFRADVENVEKSIFYGLLNSIALNNGAHLLSYLQSLEIPVKLNSEIINREKIELLADYKRYLVLIKKDKSAKKTEVHPLRPTDQAAKERVDSIMAESMYTDLKQVRIGKDEGKMVWFVEAGPFTSTFSYKERQILKVKYVSSAGEYELIFKEYWKSNGIHHFPKSAIIKTFSGNQYEVDFGQVRHFVDSEDNLIKRLRNWDQALKGKSNQTLRPEFLF